MATPPPQSQSHPLYAAARVVGPPPGRRDFHNLGRTPCWIQTFGIQSLSPTVSYILLSPQSVSSLPSRQSETLSHLAFFFRMQEPLLHWYRIAEQVVSSGERKQEQHDGRRVKGQKSNPTCREKILVERTAGVHTLGAVDLVSSVQTVNLSIAHKQRMQCRVAATLLSRPH